MVSRTQFKNAAVKAVANIIHHGDTDIFPFPFENYAFFDKEAELVDLIIEYNDHFVEYLNRFGPQNVSSLTPVTYSGFRWATQLDPIWNAYFLTCVLTISDKIEQVREPAANNVIFSYRYLPNKKTGDLFDRSLGWYQFMDHSLKLADKFKYVIACDISEFYPRLGHHRLENALKQIAGRTPYPKRIMKFLRNYSNTYSYGLPVGGPAARLLSELTINQVDRLLASSGISFARFADDYHLFTNSYEEAYRSLIFLSEKLFFNQGLTLQKSKTRIMTSAEFRTTNPLVKEEGGESSTDPEAVSLSQKGKQLMRFSLHFDPYSKKLDEAIEDYERLKNEIAKFDILGLLKDELAKSRIHTALARKIVAAVRFLEGKTRDEAVLSIVENSELLYPIYSSVLLMIDQVFDELSRKAQTETVHEIQSLIRSKSHVFRIDVHLSYAVRVLAHVDTPESRSLLYTAYEDRTSPIIRRDIILTLARWGDWYWLSDKKNHFRGLSGPERRAFIVASYALSDEGSHWREYIETELSPFEKFVMKWAGEKANNPKWEIPL